MQLWGPHWQTAPSGIKVNRYLVKYEGKVRSDGSIMEGRTFVEGWTKREARKVFEKYHNHPIIDIVAEGEETSGIDWTALILPLALLIVLYLFDRLH